MISTEMTHLIPDERARLRQRAYIHSLEKAFQVAANEIASQDEGSAALNFLQDAPRMMVHASSEDLIKNAYALLNQPSRMKALRLMQVQGLMQQASWRLAYQRPDKREEKPYHFETILVAAKEAGVSAHQVREFFSQMWRNFVMTSHPTTYLDEGGLEKFLTLLNRHGDVADERGINIGLVTDIFRDMVNMDEPIVAKGPATTLSEIRQARTYVARFHRGRRTVFKDIKQSFTKVYGEDLHLWGRHHGIQMATDLAPRAWHAVDTDGKPNAERWTALTNWVGVTVQKLEMLMQDLRDASSKLTVEGIHPEIQSLYNFIQNYHTALNPLLEKLENNLDDIMRAVPETRVQIFKAKEPEFDIMMTEIVSVHENLAFNGKSLANHGGSPLYVAVHRELERIYAALKQPDQQQARTIIDLALDDIQDGLVSYRPEPRHNAKVQDKIIDNLFRYQPFINHLKQNNIISAHEAASFRKDGLTTTHAKREEEILQHIMNSVKHSTIKNLIIASNPTEYGEDGFPTQSSEFMKIAEVAAISPTGYGPMSIIAEAHKRSFTRQSLLFFAARTDLFKSTPLLEDREALADTKGFLTMSRLSLSEDKMRAKRQAQAISIYPEIERFLKGIIPVMLARSDSAKVLGAFSHWQGLMLVQAAAYDMAVHGQAALFQEGQAGQTALERGGGDPRMFLRIVVRALRKLQNTTGIALDPSATALLMTRLMAFTRQGAALYETSREIGSDLKDHIAEMFGLHFELAGYFKKGSFIPPDQNLPKTMLDSFNSAAQKAMDEFTRYQNVLAHEGSNQSLYDSVAATAGDGKIVSLCNISARPPSKQSGNGKQPDKSTQRAIGVVLTGRSERLHTMGWLTAGKFLGLLQEARQTGELSDNDIQLLKNDPEWNDFWSRLLMSAAHFDIQHSLLRIAPNAKFLHDELAAIGKSVVLEDGKAISYDKSINEFATPEIAYLASIYWDHCCFLALSESLCNDSFASTEPLNDIIKHRHIDPKTHNARFGPATIKRFPDILEIRKAEKSSRPQLVVANFYEEKMREAPDSFTQQEIREAALTWRAAIAAHLAPVLKNRTDMAWGRRREAPDVNKLVARRQPPAVPMI